ncbi:MAG: type II toxin-antitoxin system VapB family antitoxin [Solirubrobacterales bacterium]
MRTTVSIDDNLLTLARRRAQQRHQTLGEVVEDALRRELTSEGERPPVEIPVVTIGGGVRPGVDVSSNRALRETLDEGRELSDLR